MQIVKSSSTYTFSHKLLSLISENSFLRYYNILSEPNIFKIVGRTHYERWHSCFLGWLIDTNGSHLTYDYCLNKFLQFCFDERCLKSSLHHEYNLLSTLPLAEFKNVQVSPNEFISTETSIKDLGRFDVFVSCDYKSINGLTRRMNIIFELKIDSKIDFEQSNKYADWLFKNHKEDINILIYISPNLSLNSKTTVGDERWYCLDYQLIHDKLLIPLLDHPNINPKVVPFIQQYIKNLKISYKGIKMAITEEEKRLALDLYEKYKDVFDSIYDALYQENVIDYSTSDLQLKGRKSGRIAVKINGQLLEGDMVKTLFSNILKYLVQSDLLKKLPLPWGIGNIRYIITNEDIATHPNGNPFFAPIKYQEYTIESHYARDRAISVLEALCTKLEIDFEQIQL